MDTPVAQTTTTTTTAASRFPRPAGRGTGVADDDAGQSGPVPGSGRSHLTITPPPGHPDGPGGDLEVTRAGDKA
jgi:hypothetical protein